MQDIQNNQIKIYDFPDGEGDAEEIAANRKMKVVFVCSVVGGRAMCVWGLCVVGCVCGGGVVGCVGGGCVGGGGVAFLTWLGESVIAVIILHIARWH